MTSKDTSSIAVLPFVNMSSSQDNEYFSDGITEEIINALAKIQSLKVTSRTSSFYFKNKNIPISEIGKELGVSIILEGSVRLSGDKMRITAQLIDVADDFHFFSETFDRSTEDVFSVQDEVSLLIAERLREHIGHFELEDHLIDSPNIPFPVYQKYLKGRFYLMKLDLPNSMKGISLLQEVIQEAPNFTLAYLGINQAYTYLGTMGFITASEGFIKAKPFLEKALELDADLPESQLNLAWISCWQNWDLKSTYQHLNKAIDLRPSDELYLTMSNTLTVEGNLDAAMNYVDKAIRIDPFSPMNQHYKGFLYYLDEKFEKAISYFEKSLSIQPDLHFPKQCIGQILLLEGKHQEALEYFKKLPANLKGDLIREGGMAMCYAAMKDAKNISASITQLEAELQSEKMGSAMNYLINCHTILGDYETALDLIQQGLKLHLPMMLLLKTEPIVKPLRTHPRFKQFMLEIYGDKSAIQRSPKKYKKPSLSEEQGEEYSTRLLGLMKGDKPYLESNLTLKILAEKINIHPNSLSELLNEKMGENFSEFINRYRVETFKQLAKDPNNKHLSLLGLAFESGFNSKTVFNTFFKKQTGMTPKKWLKEHS